MGDMLSQAEINALLGVVDSDITDVDDDTEANSNSNTTILTSEQEDILGEIGNISMGTAATTLFALLSQKVQITTPRVSLKKWNELSESYKRPCVGVRVDYKEGFKGSNILILQVQDVKIITNLMMGGDGETDIDGELTEIDLSAIGEAMNQMVGSSSTSLSSLLKMKIDIDAPHAFILDFQETDFIKNIGFEEEYVVCTYFRMEIGNLIDSEITQVLPYSFALKMVEQLKKEIKTEEKEIPKKQIEDDKTKQNEPQQRQEPQNEYQQRQEAQQNEYQQRPQQNEYQQRPQQNVNVQTAQFQNFDISDLIQQKENIGIIMDVPLDVTVELGRTKKKIKEILEFGPGTIIELDKIAGEPIDILVNGKYVAKGEVVVIDENFGVRITDIINVENRI